MNTQQVADKLVALCRDEKNVAAVKELYAKNIVSTEMPWVPNLNFVSTGIEAITAKNVGWLVNIETMHKTNVSDPFWTLPVTELKSIKSNSLLAHG